MGGISICLWPNICLLLSGNFSDSLSAPCTILIYACSSVIDDERLVRWFVSKGADGPDACAPLNGLSPIMAACQSAPLQTIQFLHAHGGTLSECLHYAAESRCEDRLAVMEYLLDEGADVHAIHWSSHKPSYDRWIFFGLGTPLHHAAKSGFADRVELLLRRGSDAGVLDSNGKTALEVARERGFPKIVTILTNL